MVIGSAEGGWSHCRSVLDEAEVVLMSGDLVSDPLHFLAFHTVGIVDRRRCSSAH